jgi:glycosyltransferase involved in cell wall biosynthesis
MRVLMLNHLYPPSAAGGSEKATAVLAEALVRAGHSVAVVTLCREAGESVAVENGVRVYRVPLDNLYWPFPPAGSWGSNPLRKALWRLRDLWNPRAVRRVVRILEAERSEVLHTNVPQGFSLGIWRAARRRGCRVVHTLHDYQLVCARSSMFRAGRVCMEPCTECRLATAHTVSACRHVDHVVGVSQFVLAEHRRLGRFHGTEGSVIHNIQPGATKAACGGTRTEPMSTFVFGFLGRLTEEKGIAALLRATTLLRRPDWSLHIAGVGDAAFEARLKREFPDRRIRWMGFMDRDGLLAGVDALVVPSLWHEPMGYVALEAIHAGKGLIVARSGGLPELAALAHGAVSYPPEDVPALARLMDAMIADPDHARRGGFAEPASRLRFAESAVVQAYEQVYGVAGTD